MVYCPEAGGGKGRMPWCTVQRLEVGKAGCHGVLHVQRLEVGKAGCHGVLSRGWRWERQDVMVYILSRGWRWERQDVMVYILSRGWRWERQDVMVYCPEAGGGKGRMSWCTACPEVGSWKGRMLWCTVQRLEVGKAGCHGVLLRWERQDVMVYTVQRQEMGKAGCHGVLSEAGDGKDCTARGWRYIRSRWKIKGRNSQLKKNYQSFHCVYIYIQHNTNSRTLPLKLI